MGRKVFGSGPGRCAAVSSRAASSALLRPRRGSSGLRERVGQHLVKRDSSVVTGTSAVGLNPEHVREIEWWEHDDFADRARLEAAELVAFDVFDPALRSRGRVREAATALAGDAQFADEMKRLVQGPPTGRLVLPSLVDVAGRHDGVERRLEDLERRACD